MLSVPATTRLFFCTQPVDCRRSFDGLLGLVSQFFAADPLGGHWFVFRNRRGDRLKVLYWDRDGLAIWYKRLEKGVFRMPRLSSDATSVEIDACDWALLLQGIDLDSVRRLPRYRRVNPQGPAAAAAS
jgi:transposase